MSVSACLRILLDLSQDKIARLDAMGPLVAKVADSFLAMRWPAPRRYIILTTYSYLLTDPDTKVLDVEALRSMAAELKAKLFGESAVGDVTLLLHEGDEDETARFAAMDHATLKHLMEIGQCGSTFGGRMRMMSTRDDLADRDGRMRWEPIDLSGGSGRLGPDIWTPAYQGLYFVPAGRFIGCAVVAAAAGSALATSVFEGVSALPKEDDILAFDMACLGAAAELLEGGDYLGQAVMVPIAFSSIMRPALREAYTTAFQLLPLHRRQQLGAIVYGAPRLAPDRAFNEMKTLLSRNFNRIELQITDPGFDVHVVPQGIIHTLSLRLPEAEPIVRRKAMRRFLELKTALARKEIRGAFTNVRERDELKGCLSKGVAYATGPAICGPMASPITATVVDPAQLPLAAAHGPVLHPREMPVGAC
ncbi:MAG: hypothetical protein JO303_18240 [Caulobacteraceae bacterium]|nr:hypothetical protein [Caulobacteraceae bacterium]